MHLSLILPENAYDILQKRGHITGYARRAWRHHLPAYRWMADQMREKIGPPPGRSRYPLWAWKSWNGKTQPDLRAPGHLPTGTVGYRLAIEVPDNDLLLSDFELWHFVLNGWYLALTEPEADEFEAELRAAGAPVHAPYPEPFHSRAVKTWERIFDIGRPGTTWLGSKADRSVQATLWRLSADQVKSATQFLAK